MKVQIRFGTFETNSSSTHSLVILNKQEYNDWLNGRLFFDRNGSRISGDEYNSCYAAQLKFAEQKFAEDYEKYKDWGCPEDLAQHETDILMNTYNIDAIDEHRVIDGIDVYAISIYGEDW